MSEFLIEEDGSQIWYDLKSNKIDYTMKIYYMVHIGNEPYFCVRYHREDGPAVIWPNGREAYYIKGELHREDGPAVIYPRHTVYYFGSIGWYLNSIEYSFENWCKKLNKSEEEINFLKLKWNVP